MPTLSLNLFLNSRIRATSLCIEKYPKPDPIPNINKPNSIKIWILFSYCKVHYKLLHCFSFSYKQNSLVSAEKAQVERQITPELLYQLRLRSCSRPNFCVQLIRELFSNEERRECNVKGKRGKKKLNEAKMLIVKENAFNLYPVTSGEQQHTAWRLCERAIDESCRRLNRRV